jgi:sporulation protein YlmC with PRC-barrel domain
MTNNDFEISPRAPIKLFGGRFFATWLPTFSLCIVCCLPAFGQPPINEAVGRPAVAQGHSNPTNSNSADSLILMASKLMGTELKRGETVLGQIADLVFDLETEHLAVFVLETTETGKQPQWNLFPFVKGDRLIKGEWENRTRIAARPLTFNRMQANEVYRTYKEAIYWLDFAKQLVKSPNKQFDDHDFNLTLLKNILEKPVVDKSGELAGRIEDVAINTSNGTILYLVLQTEDSRRIAIPLGAFVADDNDAQWMIDLAKDQIVKFEGFDQSAPPKKADSGWTEFVAVKYGRGGLQSKKNHD